MIKAYTDGACRGSNPGLCSCSFVVYDGDRVINSCGFYLGDGYTNNYAEYQGVLKLLEWYSGSTVPMEIYSDSMLVVLQSTGVWACDKEDLIPLRDRVKELLKKGKHKLVHVKGHSGVAGNELADKLCNEVLDNIKKREEPTTIEIDFGSYPVSSITAVSGGWPIIYSTTPYYPLSTLSIGYEVKCSSGKYAEEKLEAREKSKAKSEAEPKDVFKKYLDKLYKKKKKFK